MVTFAQVQVFFCANGADSCIWATHHIPYHSILYYILYYHILYHILYYHLLYHLLQLYIPYTIL